MGTASSCINKSQSKLQSLHSKGISSIESKNQQVEAGIQQESIHSNNQNPDQINHAEEEVPVVVRRGSRMSLARSSLVLAKQKINEEAPLLKLIQKTTPQKWKANEMVEVTMLEQEPSIKLKIVQQFIKDQAKWNNTVTEQNCDLQVTENMKKAAQSVPQTLLAKSLADLTQKIGKNIILVPQDHQFYQIVKNLINFNLQELISLQKVTQEVLLENTQILDNYINEFGLFNTLKEGLKQINYSITLDINDFDDLELQCQFKNSCAITNNSLSFRYLPFLSSNIPLKYFQILFGKKNEYSFSQFVFSSCQIKKIQTSIQQHLKEILKQDHQIQWLNIQGSDDLQSYSLLLTISDLSPKQNSQILSEFGINLPTELNTFQSISQNNLIQNFEMKLSDIDTWLNREFKLENDEMTPDIVMPKGWKMFGIKSESNENKVDCYINFIIEKKEHFQSINFNNQQGIVVSTTFRTFRPTNLLNPYFKLTNIYTKTFGMKKCFQLLLKGYVKNPENAIDLGSTLLLVKNINDIVIEGILIKEIIEGGASTNVLSPMI